MSDRPPPCPTWCTGPALHEQRIKEGDPGAANHRSCLYSAELLNARDATAGGLPITESAWSAVMLAKPSVDGHRDLPTIVLESGVVVQEPNGAKVLRGLVQLHMTPSEAETLADHLMRLVEADQADGLASEACRST